MGLIDILTHYDTKKKAAHAMKTAKHGVSIKFIKLLFHLVIESDEAAYFCKSWKLIDLFEVFLLNHEMFLNLLI